MSINTINFTKNFVKTFPAFSYKNFRYFWSGQCISLLGTWIQRTAQQWLVYSLTKSALLLGVLGVAQFGPMLLFSLFAGTIVDRYSQKRVLIFTQTALMIQALILAALVWSGYIRYWHVLILAALFGFVNTLDIPARQSFIYYLVGKEALTNGIALNSAIVNLARLIGPALAAILIVNFGAGFCFFLNGVSFIPVIFGLSRITSRRAEIKPKHEKILTATLDGLKYIKANPVIFFPVLAMLIVGTFAMNFDVILPVFADKVLHNGAEGYGFLLSASGLGSLLSAFFVITKVKDKPSRKLVYISGIVVSVMMMLAFFIRTYGLAVADIMILGFFNMLFMTLVNSTIQLRVDDKFRGRVMSVYTLAFAGTTPIGNLFAGSIIQRFGPAVGFLVCGAATGVLMLALIMWMARRKKRTLLIDADL